MHHEENIIRKSREETENTLGNHYRSSGTKTCQNVDDDNYTHEKQTDF